MTTEIEVFSENIILTFQFQVNIYESSFWKFRIVNKCSIWCYLRFALKYLESTDTRNKFESSYKWLEIIGTVF